MDSGLKRILEKLEQFKNSHVKLQLPNRRELIKQNYELFIMEYRDEANITILEDRDSISITIIANALTSCDMGGYSFNRLIGLANTTSMVIQNEMIVIDLWFRLWEWIER